jgi:GNAT superfamily N-acetyltransferase/predicted nucleic acid-binding protein
MARSNLRGDGLPHGVVVVEPSDAQLLRQVVALADKSRKTLGFLPPAAFAQAAENKTLLAVTREGLVAAYVLYALPRQIVRITHLCVAEDFRGGGLARLLVDAVSQQHADRFGIVLKCRKDYPENRLWPHLGFEAVNEIPGRSHARHPLVVWRRDHGHPDLFSAPEAVGILRVAIDMNVFLDLESRYSRPNADESQALVQDWLADQVELVVTSELAVELERQPEGPEKTRQRKAASSYWRLPANLAAVEATARRIVDHVSRTQNINLASSPSDMSDVRHMACAFMAGITVLATCDEKFINWAAKATDACSVRVIRPSDVVLHVDELSRAQAYRPVQLHDTEYQLVPVREQTETELLRFLNNEDGERKTEFLALTRSLRADGPQWARQFIRSPRGDPIAFYVIGVRGAEITIPVLRVRTSSIEDTIARQILYLARLEARRNRRSIIRITDRWMSNNTQTAARLNGFLRHEESWVALAVEACGKSDYIDAAATVVARSAGLQIQSLTGNLSAVIASDLERTLWPIKIVDSQLRSYLIPIRPIWSSELFGVPQMLIPRSALLGISREHVYYRAPRPRVVRAPARLLWYVTRSSPGGVGAVIGCSRLEQVVVDSPASLHARFRHLGVWEKKQVAAAARDGRALALRFADTELFTKAIGLDRLRALVLGHRAPLALRSPVEISSELFAAIYQEGSQAGERT